MERVFREIKDTEIRVISSTCIELKAEEGWVITDADKSFKTETTLVCLPDEKYIKDYICANYIEPEPEPLPEDINEK
jgi:hypothetical protein